MSLLAKTTVLILWIAQAACVPRNVDDSGLPVAAQQLDISVIHRVNKSLRKRALAQPSSAYITTETQDMTTDFVVQVSLGNDKVPLIVDTGSPDIICIADSFKCVPPADLKKATSADCQYGSSCKGKLQLLSDTDEETAKNLVLEIDYADGQSLKGYTGTTDVSIADIKSPAQQINFVTQGYFTQHPHASGVLGLSLAQGEVVDVHSQKNAPYPTFITKLRENNALPGNTFSIAIDSVTGISGVLGFGGRPKLDTYPTYGHTACVNLVKVSSQNKIVVAKEPTDYQVVVDDISSNGKSIRGGSKVNQIALIDTGSVALYLGKDTADAYNALWNPADKQMAPPLEITIGGITFTIPGKDLVLERKNYQRESAVKAIQNLPGHAAFESITLGLPFLRNVVTAFNVTKGSERLLFTSTSRGSGHLNPMNLERCRF